MASGKLEHVRAVCTEKGIQSIEEFYNIDAGTRRFDGDLGDWMRHESTVLKDDRAKDFKGYGPTKCAIIYGHNQVMGRTIAFRRVGEQWLVDGYYPQPDMDLE